MAIAVKTYDLLILLTSNLRSLFVLAIRVTWGYQFFLTGRGKLMNLDKVTDFFAQLHIPLPHLNAMMAGTTELVGGICLMAGLGSRFWAVGLTIVLSVALATADRETLESLDKFVKGDPFAFLFACLVVVVFGPGRYSIDFLIQHFVIKRPDKAM